MSFSLHIDVEPQFSLFAMTHDLRCYLNRHYGVPQELIHHVFLTGDRIDFSLKKDLSDAQMQEPWYHALIRHAA